MKRSNEARLVSKEKTVKERRSTFQEFYTMQNKWKKYLYQNPPEISSAITRPVFCNSSFDVCFFSPLL